MANTASDENLKLRVFSCEDEVMTLYQADPQNNKFVVFEGKVYDVKEYMPDHPGGAEYLENNLGTNIEQEFEDAEHTKAARKQMLKLPLVGKILESETTLSDDQTEKEVTGTTEGAVNVEAKYNFDYNKPLLIQIYNAGFTFDDYCQWINEPKLLTNPVRDLIFFENYYIEQITKSYWWQLPLLFVPLSLYYVTLFENSAMLDFAVVLFGMAFWTIQEYLMHRFLFHGEDYWLKRLPHTGLWFMIHYTFHGTHHAFPQDRMRLNFPPIPGCFILDVIFH